MNRASIVWLAARRQGSIVPPSPADLHLDCARSPGRGRYGFTRKESAVQRRIKQEYSRAEALRLPNLRSCHRAVSCRGGDGDGGTIRQPPWMHTSGVAHRKAEDGIEAVVEEPYDLDAISFLICSSIGLLGSMEGRSSCASTFRTCIRQSS